MGILDVASVKSILRGYDYYERRQVHNVKKIDDFRYESFVNGSENNKYDVILDLKHPRKSECTCPHASGRLVVCKHIVALYFTIFPDEAERFFKEVMEAERNEEERIYQQELKLMHYVDEMSEEEAKTLLYSLLIEKDEWEQKMILMDFED